MKFIGPFLKINSLSKENVLHQLFYLSKESIHNIVFESKCGITIPIHELNKHLSKIDSSSIKNFSPIISIYKKCSSKLTIENERLVWNTEKSKKDLIIASNGFMTLALLELCNYYKEIKEFDKEKALLEKLYISLSKLQLDFYASNLRNTQGLFIDKKHTSDLYATKLDLKEKNSSYKFSDQALLMCAYFNISKIKVLNNEDKAADKTDSSNIDKESSQYKDFAYDILDMLIEYREKIYTLTFSEKLKTCLYLNIFFVYSKDTKCQGLIFDIYDMLLHDYKNNLIIAKYDYILNNSLLAIISMLMYSSFNFIKAKDFAESIVSELISLYDENLCIFNKTSFGKTIEYSCDEILSYVYVLYLYSYLFDDKDVENILESLFKKSIVNSGLIPTWPQAPNLNSYERYKHFSKKSEDLLEDSHFRLSTVPTPEEREVAAVFLKRLYINTKKFEFKTSKFTFDSSKNMYIFFMNIFLYNNFS